MHQNSNCLIGHTGFVGGILKEQRPFEFFYNSKNFNEMRGKSFGQIVCCGVSAVKWQANREPDLDLARIQDLADVLDTVDAEQMILVSTVDVYPDTSSADEGTDCAALPNHTYGRNRLLFEARVRSRFPRAVVLRLSGLFGKGLRKNIIYDLMTGNMTGSINPGSSFQWYDVDRLSNDIDAALACAITLANLAGEPIRTQDIINSLFPESIVGPNVQPAPHYDVKSLVSDRFGGSGGYVMPRDEVMERLRRFIFTEKKNSAGDIS